MERRLRNAQPGDVFLLYRVSGQTPGWFLRRSEGQEEGSGAEWMEYLAGGSRRQLSSFPTVHYVRHAQSGRRFDQVERNEDGTYSHPAVQGRFRLG